MGLARGLGQGAVELVIQRSKGLATAVHHPARSGQQPIQLGQHAVSALPALHPKVPRWGWSVTERVSAGLRKGPRIRWRLTPKLLAISALDRRQCRAGDPIAEDPKPQDPTAMVRSAVLLVLIPMLHLRNVTLKA